MPRRLNASWKWIPDWPSFAEEASVHFDVGFANHLAPACDVARNELLGFAQPPCHRLETLLDDPGFHIGCADDPDDFGVYFRNDVSGSAGRDHEAVPAGDLDPGNSGLGCRWNIGQKRVSLIASHRNGSQLA